MTSLLLQVSAWASNGGIYVGQKTASSENDRGAVCFLKVSELIRSSDGSRFQLDAEASGMHFLVESAANAGCSVLGSNLYPEGPYGGQRKLILNLRANCQEILSYTLTDGMRAGKPVGYTCEQLKPYSSN